MYSTACDITDTANDIAAEGERVDLADLAAVSPYITQTALNEPVADPGSEQGLAASGGSTRAPGAAAGSAFRPEARVDSQDGRPYAPLCCLAMTC